MRRYSQAMICLALCMNYGLAVRADANDTIAYKPDIVGVDRMFMVALKVPTNALAIKVTVPDSVEMFDRTPLPAKKDLRKYYFRSLKPAKQADIVFAHPDGEIIISIEIWSFDDLREYRHLKHVQLPRRWPLGKPLPELKQSQTITTEAMKQAAKGKAAPGRRWLDVSDEQIWNMQPDSTIPRWHWVNITDGCPIHGTEIYHGRAFYPWVKNTSPPYNWKMKCPVGDELYPSNDFANGDMTSGEFPDDGFGGACEYEGNKYGFIAEICQAYCNQMLAVAPACADSYLATGDIRYVHKALVAMCRLAVEYAYLATMTQHRHRNRRSQVDRFGPAPFSEGPCLAYTGFTTYHLGLPYGNRGYYNAYDRIWPAIDQDDQIIPFLQSKGYNVKTHEDVRRFIEENFFAVWMQGVMDGSATSNEPTAQRTFARTVEMLNYKRGDEFMDWLYDDPMGKMRIFVTNTYFRDGAPYESTGGYNGHHVKSLGPVIESIEHLRQMRPEVYPESKYPNLSKSRRYHNVFDFSMNTINIDRTYPRVGDGGGHPQYAKRGKRTWQNGGVAAFEHAYKIFKDPKFAWALANHTGWKPSAGFPYTREEIVEQAAAWPDDWNDRSCLQDGYGLAMLRSGKGTNKRSLWMMYGRARGHAQDEIMEIGLDAYQSEILGHMGYPRNWNYWESCWVTHNVARQIPFVQMAANSQLFADAGLAHVTEAYAQAFSDKVAGGEGYEVSDQDWQRRMLAIVDVSDDQFYCVDLYRIHGGEEHWWAFHAQEGEFTTDGLELTRQEGGTLAGPDVPYGDPKWMEEHGCRFSRGGRAGWRGPMFAFPHLYNVERAAAPGVWSADWALKAADGLHFRMTIPSAEGLQPILCDGKSPAGASPYEMKWVLLHKQDEAPARSQVINVMELYNQEPVIRSVRPLQVSGHDEADFKAYGCVVELTNGRTDTIFASADGTVLRSAEGGFEFAGRFGLYSEANGLPTSLTLVGGTRLTKDGLGITRDSAEYRAKITAVDRATETITVSPAPPDPEALVGNCIYITNPVRRIAYKVLQAKAVAAGAELRLEFDSRIGTGKVTGHADHLVQTATPFVLGRCRYYHGARLLNAQRSAEYRIIGVRNQVVIDPDVHPDCLAEKLAAEFPLNSWFDLYDYGVGDEIVSPLVVSVTQVGPVAHKVTATDEVILTLPLDAETRLVSH